MIRRSEPRNHITTRDVTQHLPGDHIALPVSTVMIDAMNTFPEQQHRSVTSDRGWETAKHQEITSAIGMPIYFCDPARPDNEAGNGLLRQYLSKTTDRQQADMLASGVRSDDL